MRSQSLESWRGLLATCVERLVWCIGKEWQVGQNQWYHFGVGAPPILVYFSGDWDVHRGYGILTHIYIYIYVLTPLSRWGPSAHAAQDLGQQAFTVFAYCGLVGNPHLTTKT